MASVAYVYGALLAVIGLVIVLLAFGFGSIIGRSSIGLMMGGGMFMILLLPVFYGLLGLVFGALFAVVYNLVASRVGGIKVYISDSAD